MMHALRATRDQQERTRGAWQPIATLLVLAVSLHQLVMTGPAMHLAIMPMPSGMAAEHQYDQTDCPPPCPVPVTAICPVVQAALPHVPSMLLVLLLLTLIAPALTLVIPATAHRRTPLHAWLWPPSRHRAFLQVFRC